VTRATSLTHEFVDYIPEELRDGTLYVSIGFATAAHRCCCGCGKEVVTPLTPTDWQLTFDGETVSLYPSIGNWSFPCQSHYWIKRDRVQWAPRWSQREIEAGRQRDRFVKERYFEGGTSPFPPEADDSAQARTPPTGFWQRLKRWWRSG
jgi:hypothetical protein